MRKYKFDFILARYSGAVISLLLAILIGVVQWNACEMKTDIRELRALLNKFSEKVVFKDTYVRDMDSLKYDVNCLRQKSNGKSTE